MKSAIGNLNGTACDLRVASGDPQATSRKSQAAFTLAELLVVITIIVVLLALLMPALDQAVYQAELALCATNLSGIGRGAQVYTVDYNRRYPYRPGQDRNDKPANNLSRGADGTQFDNRPIFRGYIPSKLLVEPLAKAVDLDTTESDAAVWMAYTLWFGFRYKVVSEKGMMKLGDRFTHAGTEFSVIAADYDLVHVGALTHSAHPDLEGRNYLVGGQDVEAQQVNGVETGDPSQKATASWWDFNNHDRGPIDFNSGFDDGSVARYNKVRWNEWQDGDRFAQVPDYPGGTGFNTRYIQIPLR